MINRVVRCDHAAVQSKWFAGIGIHIEPREVAARNIHADAVPALKVIRGIKRTNRELVDFAGFEELALFCIVTIAGAHIHFKLKKGGRELLTSQIFFRGEPQNARDMVLGELRDPFDRELVIADFKPVPDSKAGEIAAIFEIVVGRTPRMAE